MKYKQEQEKNNVETNDYSADLSLLSNKEKRFIFDTVNDLMKIQNDSTALIADVPKAGKKRQRKGATL